MSALRAKRKLVLTGTPLQNHVAELWSILSFLDGNKFNDVDAFLERFGKLSTGGGTLEHVNQLNKLIKPHLLRREKEDVEKSLAPMMETLLYVQITTLQKICYKAIYDRNREALMAGTNAAGAGSMFNNVSMMLRHCCNHPWLLKHVEEAALAVLDDEAEARKPRTSIERFDPKFQAAQREAERRDAQRYVTRLVESSARCTRAQLVGSSPALPSRGLSNRPTV